MLWVTTPNAVDPDDIGDEEEAGALRVIEAHDGTLSNPDTFATGAATLGPRPEAWTSPAAAPPG